MTHLWIRAESRRTEQRVPIVPTDAARLVDAGVQITVEESPRRIFPLSEYEQAGCATVPEGSWVEAPDDAYVLGIKELPDDPTELRHTHIYFAHAYKGQDGAQQTLDRFRRGGGQLLDVEYLTLDGRRVVAFGYWAGYMGAALGQLALHGRLDAPVTPYERTDLDAALAASGETRALVIGALGRSGGGACDALAQAGALVTAWDIEETRVLDHDAILAHDLLVNCVVSRGKAEAFVRPEDLAVERALQLVADVTCDVTSEANLIPVNTAITTWDEPVRRVADDPVLDVIAIDNLPSLLPREASTSFSAELTPIIGDLDARAGAWASAVQSFDEAIGG